MQITQTLASASYLPRDVAMPRASDKLLLQSIADGDKQAMRVLFVRHNVHVYRFVLRFTGNETLAEDAVSDVFLAAWRQAKSFEGKSQVSTWLQAIARNKALSALKRRTETSLDDDMAMTIEDPADDPEQAMSRNDRSATVRKCLMALSLEHREVINLVYYHEKSIEDVARVVGIPVNTVKTRMFYARKRMAHLLTNSGEDGALS